MPLLGMAQHVVRSADGLRVGVFSQQLIDCVAVWRPNRSVAARKRKHAASEESACWDNNPELQLLLLQALVCTCDCNLMRT